MQSLFDSFLRLTDKGWSRISQADSSTKCNKWKCNGLHVQSIEDLVRRHVAQALARPVVEQIDRIVDFVLADLQEVGLLGKVLAQQPIVVLIESPLPRAVRVRKVHLGVQASCNEVVLCEFLAIVKGQRVALPGGFKYEVQRSEIGWVKSHRMGSL